MGAIPVMLRCGVSHCPLRFSSWGFASKEFSALSTESTTAIPAGSEFEPAVVRIPLTRGNGLGLLGFQAFSAILGNGAVDNGPAVETLPGIEYEKEIREPLQHHRPFTLRTFHRSLLQMVRCTIEGDVKQELRQIDAVQFGNDLNGT